jgi:hypothetical protein
MIDGVQARLSRAGSDSEVHYNSASSNVYRLLGSVVVYLCSWFTWRTSALPATKHNCQRTLPLLREGNS